MQIFPLLVCGNIPLSILKISDNLKAGSVELNAGFYCILRSILI